MTRGFFLHRVATNLGRFFFILSVALTGCGSGKKIAQSNHVNDARETAAQPGTGRDASSPSAFADSASASSQTVTFEFNEAPVDEALRAIARLFEINVIMPDDLKGAVTCALYQATLNEALTMVLQPLGYEFLRQGRRVEVCDDQSEFMLVYALDHESAETISKLVLPMVGQEKKGAVIADTVSNNLAVMGTAALHRQVQALIEKLDTPQPVVLIEVEVIEVTLGSDANFGVRWNALFNKGKHNVRLDSPFEDDAGAPLLTYGYLSSFQLQSLVEALKQDRKSKLLSNPRIVTTSGKTANILIGEKVPYVRRSTATASGGLQQEVEFEEVGIKLQVTPRVSRHDDFILVRVHPEVSEVLDQAVQGVPRIGTREATTSVATANGKTVVIGGLIRENLQKIQDKIPVLGDILPLRWIFSRTTWQNVRTELLVFITPYIINDSIKKNLELERDALKREKQE
jgi:type II secretory pathway component GspD/PulD (secretin)